MAGKSGVGLGAVECVFTLVSAYLVLEASAAVIELPHPTIYLLTQPIKVCIRDFMVALRLAVKGSEDSDPVSMFSWSLGFNLYLNEEDEITLGFGPAPTSRTREQSAELSSCAFLLALSSPGY